MPPKSFILLISILLIGRTAFAVPESPRYGAFSCVSCHVSPGGGGTITNHGRLFAQEKLSTWASNGEENILHNMLRLNDHFLMGGDARWVYQRQQRDKEVQTKFWRMQTDLEFVVHVGDFWAQSVVGTKPAGPFDNPKNHGKLIHRGYSLRYDFFDEHVLSRAGLFRPRFGLMHADHTAFTRLAIGSDADGEQTQLEVTFQNDNTEVFAAALIEDNSFNRSQYTKKGINLGLAKKLGDRSRLGAGVLQTTKKIGTADSAMTGFGISSVVSLTNTLFSLFEIHRVSNQIRGSTLRTKSESLASFLTLNYEVFKGFAPYLRHEFWNRDLAHREQTANRYGAGINWYPRPHFQTEARALFTKHQAASKGTIDYLLLLHYYL